MRFPTEGHMSNAAPPGRTGSPLVVLRKVLLSVLIGAAALSITTFTDAAGQSAMWGITLSVLIAGSRWWCSS